MRWMAVVCLLLPVISVRALVIDVPSPEYQRSEIESLDFKDAEFEQVLRKLLTHANQANEEPVSLLVIDNKKHYFVSPTNTADKVSFPAGFDAVTISIRDMTVKEAFQYCCEMSNPDMHIYFEFGLIILTDRYIQNRDPYIAEYSQSASKHYILCDHCGYYLFGLREMCSGNTMGAKWWTDGKREAPMLPYVNRLVKCPYCKDCFWPTLFIPVATVETTPSEEDYYFYLYKSCLDDAEKEEYLRTRYWWASNDQYRGVTNSYSLEDEEKENLERLLQLLSITNEYDRIQSAEIYRELGDFAKSQAMLDFQFGEEVAKSADQIRELSEQKNSKVMQLRFD